MIRTCLVAFILTGCGESPNTPAMLMTDATSADQTIPDASRDVMPTDSNLTDASGDSLTDAGIGDLTDFGANHLDSGDTNVDSTDVGGLDQGHSDSFVTPESDFGLQTDPDGGGSRSTVWMGPRLTFTKMSRANPTTPEAQDFITENIILTRGNGNGLYNIARESMATPSVSPIGTLWAMGTTADLDTLDFKSFKRAANNRLQEIRGRDMVLFLVDENIYIDVRFTSWSTGQSGGGFSYERTTPAEN